MNFQFRLRAILFMLLTLLLNRELCAQNIVQKFKLYGINHAVTGDPMVEVIYDSIQQIMFDFRGAYKQSESKSPLFACWKSGQAQIFNTYLNKFYPSLYDDIFICYVGQERDNLHEGLPKHYRYNAVSCVILKKDSLWGYISHPKQYVFHDALSPEDEFTIVEPQYSYLRYVEEDSGYDSKKYSRPKRILSVSKGKGYGAIDFKTGEEVYPMILPYPIRSYSCRYAESGFEFFDAKPEFLDYGVAAARFDPDTMLLLNFGGKKPNFEIYDRNDFDLQLESGKKIFRQAISMGDSLKVVAYDFETGELDYALIIPGNKEYVKVFKVQPNILEVHDNSPEGKKNQIKLYNLASGELIAFYEEKFILPRELGGGFTFVKKDNETAVFYKTEKYLGKLEGESKSQRIVWHKKAYLPKPPKH